MFVVNDKDNNDNNRIFRRQNISLETQKGIFSLLGAIVIAFVMSEDHDQPAYPSSLQPAYPSSLIMSCTAMYFQ